MLASNFPSSISIIITEGSESRGTVGLPGLSKSMSGGFDKRPVSMSGY